MIFLLPVNHIEYAGIYIPTAFEHICLDIVPQFLPQAALEKLFTLME